MAEVFKLFGNEHVLLDQFQQTLLQMTSNASATSLSKFFSKNYHPLYQFILRLYLTSLTAQHPDRGHASKHKPDDGYTVKEHKILSEWANLLTDDEPLNNDEPQHSLHNNHTSPKITYDEKSQFSPAISSSNTSKTISAYAKVQEKKKGSKHDHSQSFSDIAQRVTAIAISKKGGKKVGFATDLSEHKSHDDMKASYKRRSQIKRNSIWDGVLDVNNVIMVPETPKWRPRFSFQQNQLLQEGLLDSILRTISSKEYQKGSTEQTLALADECEVTSTDAMCLYLSLLCVVSSKLDSRRRDQLQTAILQRVVKERDVKQHYEFFLNSYKSTSDLKKQFQKTNNLLTKRTTVSTPTFSPISSRSSASIVSTDEFSLNSPGKATKNAKNIIQQTPESAISLFRSIFRHNLSAGSMIQLCRESMVTDPINCHAPPLSRIEIRKIIATNSKPYLVDLYVANRSDNFEYLSSTVILKKGDDLRRDAAVLHVFRLMNKIWREKGLEFTQVPVNALTYKCIAISPDFGMIELIEGCKPLRMVSALEDTITIAQQFNLVASAAGSYMASYIMGVRDRHFDNVLIRDNDCALFHIDFGFVLGDTAGLDSSKFAITKDLKKLMGRFWDKFIELGVQAFLSLRQKHKYLIKYAQIAFEYLEKGDMVEEFIKHQLHIEDMADDKAAKYIARKLKESPDSVKTKFKNVVHQIATMKK